MAWREFWKNDLPEGFDPMTAKELRQSLRRGSFVLPFLAIQVLALIAMVAEFKMGHAAASSEYTGVLNPWLLWSSGPFWMVVGIVCMILMPLGGVVLMGQELEEGNHELLLLTKLNRWKIVFGKFARCGVSRWSPSSRCCPTWWCAIWWAASSGGMRRPARARCWAAPP